MTLTSIPLASVAESLRARGFAARVVDGAIRTDASDAQLRAIIDATAARLRADELMPERVKPVSRVDGVGARVFRTG